MRSAAIRPAESDFACSPKVALKEERSTRGMGTAESNWATGRCGRGARRRAILDSWALGATVHNDQRHRHRRCRSCPTSCATTRPRVEIAVMGRAARRFQGPGRTPMPTRPRQLDPAGRRPARRFGSSMGFRRSPSCRRPGENTTRCCAPRAFDHGPAGYLPYSSSTAGSNPHEFAYWRAAMKGGGNGGHAEDLACFRGRPRLRGASPVRDISCLEPLCGDARLASPPSPSYHRLGNFANPKRL